MPEDTALLTEFLLARITEDEAAARDAVTKNGAKWTTEDLELDGWRIEGEAEVGNPRAHAGSLELWDDEGAMGMFEETAKHVVRWEPRRVLAECVSKRQILASLDMTPCPCQRADRCVIHDVSATSPERARERYVDHATDVTLRSLALPYAGHPDYREEWGL